MANAGFDTRHPTPINFRVQEIIGQIVLYTLDKLSYNRFQKTRNEDIDMTVTACAATDWAAIISAAGWACAGCIFLWKVL